MNLSEVRKTLLFDPRRTTPEIEEALRNDVQLAALRRQLLDLNGEVTKLFAEVVPPAGLADRIILRVRFRNRSRWMAGIAASALVMVLSFAWLREPSESPIAIAMLDHVVEGVDELADAGSVSAQTAKTSLARIGVGFQDAGYQIRHLSECVVAGRIGRHLVMNTPDGLVSFLILPRHAEEVTGRQSINKGNFQAVLQPAQQVAIGVFADRKFNTKRMEAMMQQMFSVKTGEA